MAGASWSTFSDGTSASTGATVTGLTNDTAYEFRVAAVNSEGQGDWSNVAGPYTPEGVAATRTIKLKVAGTFVTLPHKIKTSGVFAD